MITYTARNNKVNLEGVFALQKDNLKKNLSKEEIEKDGFVTVDHEWEKLVEFTKIEPHIIALDEDKVVGYVLAMTKKSRFDLPIIFPMFEEFDKIIYKGKIISEYEYMVVGQACIHKDYRGKGIIEVCFQLYKTKFADRYDFSITEIASTNLRSLKAHKKAGYEEIHSYTDADQTEWIVVVWNWNNLE